jgi:hypothetical protein
VSTAPLQRGEQAGLAVALAGRPVISSPSLLALDMRGIDTMITGHELTEVTYDEKA